MYVFHVSISLLKIFMNNLFMYYVYIYIKNNVFSSVYSNIYGPKITRNEICQANILKILQYIMVTALNEYNEIRYCNVNDNCVI